MVDKDNENDALSGYPDNKNSEKLSDSCSSRNTYRNSYQSNETCWDFLSHKFFYKIST